jgi:hypothetical protein
VKKHSSQVGKFGGKPRSDYASERWQTVALCERYRSSAYSCARPCATPRIHSAARRLVLHVEGGYKIFGLVSTHAYKNMTLTHQQLAELLAGIARSQQAIVDAMDRAQPGFRGTYLLPTLNVAANLRIPQVRLLDLPSRILLRSQGRVPMDAETIQRALQEALEGSVAFDPPPAPPPALSSAITPISAETEDEFFQS